MPARDSRHDVVPVLVSDGVVRFEVVDRIAIITLNRPEVLNAVNHNLAQSLGDALEQFSANSALRVAIITGAGRAFCAGQDVTALVKGEPVGPDREGGFGGITRRVIDKPLIAAVNGLAYGGGLEIALSCDVIVMSEEATLALPEVKLGLIAAGGGLPRIAQDLPPKVAAKLVFTGDPLDSQDALRWGLVSDVVPQDRVVPRAMEIAQRIARNSPQAVRASKRSLRLLTTESSWSETVWSTLADEFTGLLASPDLHEGAQAFLERRAPRWTED